MIETILKLVQITFYAAATIVAVLTYYAARRGLLNTVNTEYYKKVIDNLSALSEELYSEFDWESERSWTKSQDSKEFVDGINEQVRLERHEILTKEDWTVGVPVTSGQIRLMRLASRYRSDPFLPIEIRSKVLFLLESRLQIWQEACIDVAQLYVKHLKSTKQWVDLSKNEGWIHNEINKRLNKSGFGIEGVETAVDEIRSAIQSYFAAFNPNSTRHHLSPGTRIFSLFRTRLMAV